MNLKLNNPQAYKVFCGFHSVRGMRSVVNQIIKELPKDKNGKFKLSKKWK